MYHVGDYVYVEPAEPNLQPHIIYIERLWQDDTGQSHYQTIISIYFEQRNLDMFRYIFVTYSTFS